MTQTQCPVCNTSNDEENVFCPDCGTNLSTLTFTNQVNSVKFNPQTLSEQISQASLLQFQDLQSQLQSYKGLDEELAEQQAVVYQLEQSEQSLSNQYHAAKQLTEAEKLDVEKLESMTWTSFKARLSGNREEQIADEHAEYLDALARQQELENEISEAQIRLQRAQQQLHDLKTLDRERYQLQNQLNTLVATVMDQVTHPEEDKLEELVKDLQQRFHPLNGTIKQVTNCIGHLREAVMYYEQALGSLDSAKGYSDWDTFFGGGFVADSMKNSRTSQARSAASRGNQAIHRARQSYPQMPPVGSAHVENPGNMDFFFDNIFTDIRSRDRIHRSRENMQIVVSDARRALNSLNHQKSVMQNDIRKLAQQLENAEHELFQYRLKLFEEVIRQQS